MNDAPPWMIYGANGYTGRLLAEEAARRDHRPILAGRNRDAVTALAERLGCPVRIFALESPQQIAGQLADVKVVAHCAGPFSATAAPMMDAAIQSGTHYCDITGEIDVIVAGASRGERAAAAGIALMPAVGFDVVPTDCLAATIKEALPDAVRLEMAFDASGGMSPGTAKTSVEGMTVGGRVRIDGVIQNVPVAWKSMEVPFKSGKRWATTIPWGDVASAYYTTGIPNIEVYLAMPPARIRQMRRARFFLPLMKLGPLQRFAKWRIKRSVHGPTESERKVSHSSLWGRVTNGAGRQVEATMETIGGYPLTVLTMLATVENLLGGTGPVGFATPAMAFGKDFIVRAVPETQLDVHAESVRQEA